MPWTLGSRYIATAYLSPLASSRSARGQLTEMNGAVANVYQSQLQHFVQTAGFHSSEQASDLFPAALPRSKDNAKSGVIGGENSAGSRRDPCGGRAGEAESLVSEGQREDNRSLYSVAWASRPIKHKQSLPCEILFHRGVLGSRNKQSAVSMAQGLDCLGIDTA